MRRRVPIRVCVTGTRGKSSVTRLVAAALRESGLAVLAKTTGSKAVLILPDGSEIPVRRRGLPTILEQKMVIRLAARLGAKALVAEMMSIRGECLFAESNRILRPGLLILTNVRLDHVDLMGRTKAEIAASLASAIPRNGAVVIPEAEQFPVFVERAAALGSRILSPPGGHDLAVPEGEFEVNVRMAVEAARILGVGQDAALRGIAAARPDFGSLRAWEIGGGEPGSGVVFVSAFAANDPESTIKALEKAFVGPGFEGRKRVGLLNLRADRGDRTRQWAEALESGQFDRLDALALMGRSSRAMAFRLRRRSRWKGDRLLVLREDLPASICRKISAAVGGPAVIVGMGNIGGAGTAMVESFEIEGRPRGF